MNEPEEVDKSSLEFQVPAPLAQRMAKAFDEHEDKSKKICLDVINYPIECDKNFLSRNISDVLNDIFVLNSVTQSKD